MASRRHFRPFSNYASFLGVPSQKDRKHLLSDTPGRHVYSDGDGLHLEV